MPELSQKHFSSMHVYFGQLAEALNDSGSEHSCDVAEFVRLSGNQLKLPWNKDLIKELWRVVQISMTSKKSTLAITPYEALRIYEVFDRKVSEISGVSIEWPHDREREDEYGKRTQ